MAFFSSTLRGRVFKFQSTAADAGTLFVTAIDGRETLSKPYRFEVELWSPRSDLDAAAFLREPAALALKQGIRISGGSPGVQTLRIHGVLSSFEQGETAPDRTTYRAVLVPRFWNLLLQHRCRIFLEKTVPEIVQEILRDNGLTPEDWEFRTTRAYPRREFVMQYHETDFSFVSRLLEHEGIFYLFRQEESKEKVIFGDATSAYEAVAHPDTVPYGVRRPGTAAAGLDELFAESIPRASMQTIPLPREVILRDYYDQDPDRDQEARADVSPDGRGVDYQYGEHFRTAAEGRALAQVRSEEWKARERVLNGRATVRSFRGGHVFALSEHPRADMNARYLLTRVVHRAEQRFEAGSTMASSHSYTCDFSAIPADRVFRPERQTPKPRVSGSVFARIDAAGSGEYAEIDDQGRYRVVFPLDLSGRSGGTASCPVRMAQPYAGGGMGMHFPLHRGTEVIVTFVNGDPDRPIISAAVPNPTTGSPVVGGNQTQCAITTGGGTSITIEDTAGSQYMNMEIPGGYQLSLGQEHHSIHAPEGASLMSADGIILTAGSGVVISAGAATHDLAHGEVSGAAQEFSGVAQGIAATVAAFTAGAMDAAASGYAAFGAIAADAAGCIGGWSMPSVYINAPGKIFAGGMSEVVIAGGLCADLVSTGAVAVMARGFALLTGLVSTTVTSVGMVEVVSGSRNVAIHAKTLDVDVHAHRNVEIKAHHDVKIESEHHNIEVKAHDNLHLIADHGWAKLEAHKQIEMKSTEDKRILLEAGDSSITLENEVMTIKAKKLILRTTNDKCVMTLDHTGAPSLDVTATKNIKWKTDETLFIEAKILDSTSTDDARIRCRSGVSLNADSNDVTVESDLLVNGDSIVLGAVFEAGS